MSLADELLNLRRELAAATSPLQRMQMLARSWRSVRQLSPAERRQLAKAVGADGVEGVLDRIAARKGRVGASFLVPSLEQFKGMDPNALGRLIEALRDPDRRRQVLEEGTRAVGNALSDEPAAEPEADPAIEDQAKPEAEIETGLEGEYEPHEDPVPQSADAQEIEQVSADDDDAPTDEPTIVEPAPEASKIEPAPQPPAPPPRFVVVPPPPVPPREERPSSDYASRTLSAPGGESAFEQIRDAPTLVRRLAMAREALGDGSDWSADRVRALLDLFPHDWARRRILVAMLERGLVEDTPQAIDLIGSLESRASRRWCVSRLLHARQLSEAERQTLLALD